MGPDGNGKLLITGGGAFNKFLIERIDALCPCEIEIPSRQIIEYKEALIFAFLGALFMADTPGCLASVTGATTDNIGGNVVAVGQYYMVLTHSEPWGPMKVFAG